MRPAFSEESAVASGRCLFASPRHSGRTCIRNKRCHSEASRAFRGRAEACPPSAGICFCLRPFALRQGTRDGPCSETDIWPSFWSSFFLIAEITREVLICLYKEWANEAEYRTLTSAPSALRRPIFMVARNGGLTHSLRCWRSWERNGDQHIGIRCRHVNYPLIGICRDSTYRAWCASL